jgi:dihydroorotate dehydrogenase (NAD+) catalytic subunit
MNLRGINFGNVFVASGTLNFFGEGWRHHKIFKMLFGLSFNGATFVSKTTTLNYREGNLDLNINLQPQLLFPDCIRVRPVKGVVLNSVGLSGPGAEHLFAHELWQKRTESFFISFMAVDATKKERVREAKEFAEILARELPSFSAKVGLELNISCPNTAHETLKLVDDAVDQLKAFANLGIPVILKINALTSVDAVIQIADSGLCDAITVSNTIPWGQLPEKIDWQEIFGSTESPLKHLGGGGLSGYPLLPIVARWISEAREKGVTIPIIGGGGILKKDDVDFLHRCGADAIAIGSVAILRPWRVQGIIKRAKQIYGGE